VPFVTERVWGALFAGESGLDSVHLSRWPELKADEADQELAEAVDTVRRLVELGRAARASSGVKTRQPLARMLVSAPGWSRVSAELHDQLKAELNVLDLAALADADELVDITVKPNFRALGKRFGSGTQAVAAAIAALPARGLAAALAEGTASVRVAGVEEPISPEDVIVTETPRTGWAVASAGPETVALDLELTHELRLLGLLRDVVRTVQEARKGAGLEVTDRIELWWRVGGSPEPAEAIRTHSAALSEEVLATTITEVRGDVLAPSASESDRASYEVEDDDLGLHVWLRRA
jgi:isoleucyl-tRNA synthetase